VHFTPDKTIVFQGVHILPTIYIVFFANSWYINIETYVHVYWNCKFCVLCRKYDSVYLAVGYL